MAISEECERARMDLSRSTVHLRQLLQDDQEAVFQGLRTTLGEERALEVDRLLTKILNYRLAYLQLLRQSSGARPIPRREPSYPEHRGSRA